ncbi:MAG: SLBB domain-containing protein, partial [Polyangia bacterium]|nr:SLBB domain-containing protein [Polyangia bacterium]
LDQLQAAGVVGMGGAGFPTHAKYRFAAEVVVANGAECEPLLWTDKRLLSAWAGEVWEGLARAVQLVGAQRGILAVKKHYGEVVDIIGSALGARGKGGAPLELFLLRNTYPAGDEFTLVQQVLGRTLPEAGLPLHRGVVVSNVATLRAVHRALAFGEALTTRLVTVTGEVARPGVFEAPIGASLAALVEAAGGPRRKGVRLIAGGPMMGQVVTDPATPVLKTTSGLLVLPSEHPLVRRKLEDPKDKLRLARAACCLCMSCTDVCPRHALGHRIWPHRLMQSVAAGLSADTEAYLGALLCCECGLCTQFGCPLHLDPCRMNIEVKAELRARGMSFPARPESQPSPFWQEKQVPAPRLLARLELSRYARALDLITEPVRCGEVTLLTRQGVGQPATPSVEVGQAVTRGQTVAKPGGKLSAALHASMDGVVAEVTPDRIVVRRPS